MTFVHALIFVTGQILLHVHYCARSNVVVVVHLLYKIKLFLKIQHYLYSKLNAVKFSLIIM